MSVIALQGVGKSYAQYAKPADRLLEVLTGRQRHSNFVALHPVDLNLQRGEVLGLIGMNGAGKSTLLKLIAGTILPSTGQIHVNGRISALLELGAGFHPEMSGRENVYLTGAVQGMTTAQIDELYDGIVAFSGLSEFMAQPVKTYSSGMFVRLAFAVATCVQPDILIVDEALSVGDGAFALKSFKRIMGFKEAGGTILFCSHSLYQVEAICSRVIWVHQGRVVLEGDPANVTAAYGQFLDTGLMPGETTSLGKGAAGTEVTPTAEEKTRKTDSAIPPQGQARLKGVAVSAGGITGTKLSLESGKSDLIIRVGFVSDSALIAPSLAVTLVRADGSIVASVGSFNDGFPLRRRSDGSGEVAVTFARLPLLKGEYWVTVLLVCEQAVHLYDQAAMVAHIKVSQQGLEQGIVSLPHAWQIPAHILEHG